MILEETKMASVVLDEEEEAPSEPSATLLDGDGGDEDASKEEGAPAEDGTM